MEATITLEQAIAMVKANCEAGELCPACEQRIPLIRREKLSKNKVLMLKRAALHVIDKMNAGDYADGGASLKTAGNSLPARRHCLPTWTSRTITLKDVLLSWCTSVTCGAVRQRLRPALITLMMTAMP